MSDWYQISNLPNLIDEPGKFAVVGSGKKYRVYVWAPDGVDLERQLVEGSRRGHGLRGQGVSHVSFIGLDVTGTTQRPLSFDHGEHNTIRFCCSYNNRHGPFMGEAFGLYLSEQKHSKITNCISVLNGCGINVFHSSDCVIENNISGRNIVDAMVVSWNSHRVRVARNFAFDNWDQNHPDGFQTYRAVVDLTLESNLFMSVGQGWQSAETQGARAINNVWAGIHHFGGINYSKRQSEVASMEPNKRLVFENNTTFSGSISTGFDGRAVNNIRLSGIGLLADGLCDYNLYSSRSESTATPYHKDGKDVYSKNFTEWQEKVSPNSAHDRVARVHFRNGPAFETKTGNGETGGSSETKISSGTSGFAVGDHIELDCDGIVRTVVAVSTSGIALQPAPVAGSLHGIETIVWNWKELTDFTLDTRLADDSPGKQQGKDGVDIGSAIDVQSYMRGDFDSDGKRDVPDLPPAVRRNVSNHTLITRYLHW